MDTPDLSDAYALNGPEACRTLYAGWADSYDAGFAATMDYRLPAEVAAHALRAGPIRGAVLDVGAGTGLVAAALRGLGHAGPIDGVDLSAAMLERAAAKGLYRHLIEGDVTRPLALPRRYGAILSAGTFTHGHVGPEALALLLSLAEPGAVVALSVNAAIWEPRGFGPTLASLGPRIRDLDLCDVAIYGEGARRHDPGHAGDTARLVRFVVR